MIHDPQFWVALSFVLFVALVFKPVGKILGTTLDGRAAKIQRDLDEAQRLKDEAQQLLASYQLKQKESQVEATKIIANAEAEAKRILADAEKNLEENLNKKIQVAMQKIASYEHSVMQDVRLKSIDIAIGTVRNLIKEKMTKEASVGLVEKALGEMNKKLH